MDCKPMKREAVKKEVSIFKEAAMPLGRVAISLPTLP